MKELTVGDLMTRNPLTLGPDDDLVQADKAMRLFRVRHLPVVDEDMRVLGLITHRDILRAQTEVLAKLTAGRTKKFVSMTARDLMTKNVRTVAADGSAAASAKLMLTTKFGCLPVVEAGRLVGIVTEADFLRWAMKELFRREIGLDTKRALEAV